MFTLRWKQLAQIFSLVIIKITFQIVETFLLSTYSCGLFFASLFILKSGEVSLCSDIFKQNPYPSIY